MAMSDSRRPSNYLPEWNVALNMTTKGGIEVRFHEPVRAGTEEDARWVFFNALEQWGLRFSSYDRKLLRNELEVERVG